MFFGDYWEMTNNIGLLRLLEFGQIILVFWSQTTNNSSNNYQYYLYYWYYWYFTNIIGFFCILPIIWPIFYKYYWYELNYCYFTNIIGIIGISNNLAIILVNIGPMPEMTNNIGKIIGNTNNTNNIGKTSIFQSFQ